MRKSTLLLGMMIAFAACDDLDDKELENGGNGDQVKNYETTGVYVLNEGSWNGNNSTLAYYDFKSGELNADRFTEKNKRGLGSLANDMKSYGSKLYIVVNGSSQVEILDLATGRSLKQIPMFTEDEQARQPRQVAFFEDKAYVCSFDGTVVRIDTASMEIDATVKVGRQPDGLCVQNGKLYVSNSGGLDYPNYDNTVSVVDLKTFQEIKKIEVVVNPYIMHPDKYGDVYVVSRGNYADVSSCLQRIDSKTDSVVEVFEGVEALNFCIDGDWAYLYNYDYNVAAGSLRVLNVATEQIERDSFITDSTKFDTPYGINVNPVNGDVYLTNVADATMTGDLFCFSKEGKLKFKLADVGLNPNSVAFVQEPVNE